MINILEWKVIIMTTLFLMLNQFYQNLNNKTRYMQQRR